MNRNFDNTTEADSSNAVGQKKNYLNFFNMQQNKTRLKIQTGFIYSLTQWLISILA